MNKIKLKDKQRGILKAMRKEKGISLLELSKSLKMNITRLQRVESGEYELSISEVAALELYYNKSIYDSLKDTISL